MKGNEQLEKIQVNANEENEEVKATSIDNPFLMKSLDEEASLGKVPSLKPKYGGSNSKTYFHIDIQAAQNLFRKLLRAGDLLF